LRIGATEAFDHGNQSITSSVKRARVRLGF
jgi:hypothetical protein